MFTKRILLVLGLALLTFGCGGDPSLPKGQDVTKDANAKPVSSAFASLAFIDELANIQPQERSDRLYHDYRHLGQDIVYFLGRAQKLVPAAKVEKVELLFGSIDSVLMYDAAGVKSQGYLWGQLLVKVTVTGASPNDGYYLVKSLNKIAGYPTDFAKLQSLGLYVPPELKFTIRSGQKLTDRVGYLAALDFAERFGLPVYNGEMRLPPEVVKRIENPISRAKFTVGAREGDQFDLIAGSYSSSKKAPAKRKCSRA